MSFFNVFGDDKLAGFIIESESFEGIKMIGETVAEDILCVTGKRPDIVADVNKADETAILMATCGNSKLLEKLTTEGKINLDDILGKHEVYKIIHVTAPFGDNGKIRELLVIAGSDKRGTIYGMFRLSRLCGVSPLIYFGDAKPEKKEEVILELDKEIVSKEPSVRYRGFFINDEWPAFGNWCTEKFGDVNAKAYRKIFELLLRLNGNYFWPAMWNSSFSEDGPGLENAILADKLGVIMGASHHEPMCRAGVEWQRQYKKYSDDSTWSFISNAEGISRFWEDGVKRNKAFENVITIGMRGESDSKLLPENATLKENIDVIKKAIKAQNAIIKEQVNPDLKEVPRMLAIYKEVEDYYYGDKTCEGLKDWDELEDVIFLLSDDNHGNVRALPTKEEAKHPGGFGMYYHFDYHGGPISYEWVNCNRLTKTWEQMSLAYEAGVRDMWIVNVGDLKFNEYPLCFFMELAYNYEEMGEKALNKTEDFAKNWIDIQFGNAVTLSQKEMIASVLEGYTRWNNVRTPETMNEMVYNPVDFLEGDRVYKDVSDILEKAETLKAELAGNALCTYLSMIYYPAAASLNLILMYLERGMNRELAQRGCVYANHYAKSVQERIADDIRYVEEFHRFNDGKWNHMMSSAHTGFRSWDDYNWTYPSVETVTPIHAPKAVVSFRGSRKYNLGSHWQGMPVLVSDEFERRDTEEVLLDIDSRGDVDFSYEIKNDTPWLKCDCPSGKVAISDGGRKTVKFSVDRKLIDGAKEAGVKVCISFDNGVRSETDLLFKADSPKTIGEKNLFAEKQGLCCVSAEHFSGNTGSGNAGFEVIRYLGKTGSAIKVFPGIMSYSAGEIAGGNVPYVKYNILLNEEGEYTIDFHLLMRNPIVKGGRLKFGYSVNDGEITVLNTVPENYASDLQSSDWIEGILNRERIIKGQNLLKKGVNTINFYAGDAGVILEKLVVYNKYTELPKTFLGPKES